MSDVWLQIVCLSAVLAVCAAGLLPAAPAHYSSAAAVSSQSIVRHDEHAPAAKLAVASPLAYHAAPSVAYHTAPAPVTYHAPAPIAYHSAPAPLAYHTAPVAKVLAPAHKVLLAARHEEEYVS